MKKYIITLFIIMALLCSCAETGKESDTDTLITDTDTETVTADTEAITTDAITETEAVIETDETEKAPETDTSSVTETETEEATTKPDPVEIATPKEMFVTINEVCASNAGCFTDNKGETPDWIELYNSSDNAINLAGFGISDETDKPMRYTFSNYLIEAKSYVILLATGSVGYNNGVISLPFKLSSEGETLTLTAPDGLTDIMTVPELGENETYGRATDGGDIACHLTPTPLATNNTAMSIIKVPAPEFSHTSGFYSEGFDLAITIPKDCVVYYTTDGSTPTAQSQIYGEPITLDDATENPNVYSAIGGTTINGFVTKNNQDKANVIRAIAIDREGNISKVTSGTFFVTRIMTEDPYESIPILSVYTDGSNLFDYETGIYVLGKTYDDYMKSEEFDPETPNWSRPANYFIDGMEGERPATIEYFDAEHEFCFVQDVGIRIGGNTSQSSVQKSFKFYARSEYGKSSFDYPMFEGVEFYDTFLMRTGANDFAKTKIRDVLAQTLVSHRNISTAKWQPCAMFLNGEYWGFYMMMERYDPDYFEEHYDVNKDDVVAVKAWDIDIGTDSDWKYYRELRDFCKNNDLTLPENYEKLCSMIDMQSFIDYVCLNVIINNHDWPGNNTEYWRTRTADPSNPYADGRWRWAVYDTERSMRLYGAGSAEDAQNNTYTRLIKNGIIFGYVYKNEEFKKQFLTTLMDMLEKDFDYQKIDEYLNFFEENYNEQMKKNRERYNTTANYPAELESIRIFWQNRTEYLLKYTCELFEIGSEIIEVAIKAENAEGGKISLFDYALPLEDGRYSGDFLAVPMKLKAEAEQGYHFAGWKASDGSIISTEDIIELDPALNDSITALFEKNT
ncbi:MAG: CotH kinase family protein [Clostridia bacterium]|nr:CotH kinase family protein [Clostridia bacterium]